MPRLGKSCRALAFFHSARIFSEKSLMGASKSLTSILLAVTAIIFTFNAYGDPHQSRPLSDVAPDLSTMQGKLQLVRSLTERHPGVVSSNLRFHRNLLDVLGPVPDLEA